MSSARCPFCDGALDFEVSPPLLPDRRLSRSELMSFKTLVSAGVLGTGLSTFAGACAVYGEPCTDDCVATPIAPDASDANVGGRFDAGGKSGVGGAAIGGGGRGGSTSSGGAGGVAGAGASDGGNVGGAGGEQGGEGGA